MRCFAARLFMYSLCLLGWCQALFAQSLAEANRWVSAGGSLTEWAVLLGAESLLVGVDSTSRHPARLQQLPNIGYQRQLSAEGVLALKPNLLIGTEEMGPPPALQQLNAAGVQIEIFSAKPDTQALYSNLQRLGDLLQNPQKATVAWQAFQRCLQRQTARNQQAQQYQAMPGALLFIGGTGPVPLVAGRGTVGDWLIRQAGGHNLATHSGYKPLAMEALVAMNPQVVLVADRQLQGQAAIQALIRRVPALASTQAMHTHRVRALDATLLVSGIGPRLPEAIDRLFTAFYPAASDRRGAYTWAQAMVTSGY